MASGHAEEASVEQRDDVVTGAGVHDPISDVMLPGVVAGVDSGDRDG